MRRNLYSTWLFTAILFVASLFCSTTASASHAVGTDMTYTYLGNNTYRFTMTFYRDCAGITPSTAFTAYVNGCGNAVTNFTLTQIGAPTEITPLCPTGTSTCGGGTVPGVTQYTYTGTYTFPSACASWQISTTECCRNAGISTIASASGFDLYTACTLNNTISPVTGLPYANNSPDFTQPPVPYVCAGQAFTYNHGVIDFEGDSLVYTSTPVLDSPTSMATAPYPGIPISYIAPTFSVTTPISMVPGTGGYVVNPNNGQTSFTPSTVGQITVVAILVKEYRNGVLISTIRRDVQIIVINCGSNQTPQLGTVTNVVGATFTAQNNSGTFRICPGQTMSFSIPVTDANAAQVLSIVSNAATNFPGAVVNITNGTGNTRIFNFTWTPTASSTGVRTLAIEARDNNCPTYGFSVEGYTIIVQGVNGSADVGALCFGTPTVVHLSAQAQVAPGGVYTWTANPPIVGTPTLPSTQSITVTITKQTTFTVTYVDGICNATDTVIVQGYGPVSASPATVNAYCPTDPAIPLIATYSNPAPVPPPACTAGVATQCTGAQSNRTIGGTGANTLAGGGVGTPYQGFWHDGRMQILYTAAELTGAGVQPGLILGCQFNVSQKNSTAPYKNWTIKLACTPATSLNAATGYVGGTTIVYSNVAGVTPVVGLNNYVFTTPYRWDGVSSLVVEICYDNTAFTGYDHVTMNTLAATRTLYTRQDGAAGCSLGAPIATTVRPDIVLRNCPIVVPPAGVTYAWSVVAAGTGSVSNAAIANPTATVAAGTPNGATVRYIVTANDGRCTSKDTVIVNVSCIPANCVVNPSATPVTSNELTCTRTTLQLTAANSTNSNLGTMTYAWKNSAGTTAGITSAANIALITVNAPGTYIVTVTNTITGTAATTCTATASVIVTQNNTPPVVTLTSDIATITCIDVNATLTATPNAIGSQYTYVWAATNGGSAFGFTGFTNNTTVGGCYQVTVTNTDNGCTNTGSVCITKNITQPVVTISPSQNLSCAVTSVTLDASLSTPAGVDFLWSGSAVPPTLADIAPTRIVTSATAGTHTVTVTYAISGCTASATRVVTIDTITPAMTLTANRLELTCANPTATLTASLIAGHNYTWSANVVPVTTANVTTVSAPGTYTVTITNATSGCTRSRTIVITQNTTLPVVALASSATEITCLLNSITLTATPAAGSTYTWSLGATPVAATNTATVTAANTYTVTVTTTANGCTGTASATITASLTPPTVTITPPLPNILTCTNPTLGLTANSVGSTFGWSANANNATTALATVSAAGIYTVTATTPANGCTATATRLVTIDTITPAMTLTANRTTLTCTNPTATLTATNVLTHIYIWSAVASSSNNTATVNLGGTYSVTITNPTNGCSRTRSITIIEDKTPPLPIIAPPATLTCANPTVTLDATGTSPATGVTFAWSPSSTAGATYPVTTPGTYTVTATLTANGCTETTAVIVGQDLTPAAPIITASAPELTCTVTPLLLTATAGGTVYTWSGGTAGASANIRSVTTPGIYTVTMTSAATGCTGTASFTVIQNITPPTPTISASQLLTCLLTSTQVTAGGGVAYAWSGGATPTTAVNTFNAPGAYTVTVTSGANGCTATRSTTILQNITLPTTAITGAAAPQLTCGVTSTTLTASGATTYLWSTGATTTTISVNAPATYTVTGTLAASGCTTTATFVVVQNITPPVPTITPDFTTITCTNPTINMTVAGTAVNAFVWDNGTTTSPRAVTVGGTYTVTATTTANACTATAEVTIFLDKTPPTVAINPPTVITCTNPTATLTATGADTYVWNAGAPGATSDLNTVSAAGTYTVTGTSASNGCTNTASIPVTNDITPPTIAIVGAPDTVLTCVRLNLDLVPSGAVSYAWDATQVTSQNAAGVATVSQPGTYIVTATAANGCTATRAQIVLQNITLPTLGLNTPFTNITCSRPSVTSTAGGADQYVWSNGINIASNTFVAPQVNAVGSTTYTVTGTSNANGCTATREVVITYDKQLPTPTMDSDTSQLTCGINIATISALGLGNDSFVWATSGTGNIVSNPTSGNAITVNQPGIYSVTVTSSVNDCTDTGTYTITQNITPPVVTITTPGPINCTFPIRRLTAADINLGYVWTGPTAASIVTQINNIADVNATGIYEATATDPINSCTATGSITVVDDLAQPVANITSNGALDCATTSIVLTAAPADTYEWSSNAQNAVTPNVTIIAPGTYTVTVKNSGNGCTNSASFVVTQDTVRPVIALAADFTTINCTNPVSTLTVTPNNPNYGFAWTNGVSLSNTAQVITGATYTVTVTNSTNSCQRTASIVIAEDKNPPAPIITSSLPQLNCAVQSLELSVSDFGTRTYSSVVWDDLSSNNPRTVNAPLTYTVTVTDAGNGCTATATFLLTRNITPPIVTIAPPATLTCLTTNIVLSATATPSTVNYTWSNGNNGPTTITPVTVTDADTYSVEATNPANGCTASATVLIPRDTITPVIVIAAPAVLTCVTQTITLSATGGEAYDWSAPSTPNGLTATTATPGVYTVTATHTDNGCTASKTVTVTQDIVAPVPTISADVNPLTCVSLVSTLSALGGDSYDWSTGVTPSGSTGTVTAAGTYFVTATLNSNGCKGTASFVVVEDKVAPTIITAANNSVLTCAIMSADLIANGADTYVWSPNGSTASPYNVTTAGTYTVVGTQNSNGCTAIATITITEDKTPPNVTATTNDIITCAFPTATITASIPGNPSATYVWSPIFQQNGDIAQAQIAGIYTVTATLTSNGCTAETTIAVTDDLTPPNTAIDPVGIVTCATETVALTATGASNGYSWTDSNGSNIGVTPTITVIAGGLYTVVGTAANGCTAATTINVQEDKVAPLATLVSNRTVLTCANPTASLLAGTGDTYQWSPNAVSPNGPNAQANGIGGTYIVTVTTNSNGCTASASVVITQDVAIPVYTVAPSRPILNCTNPQMDLVVTPNIGDFVWSPTLIGTTSQVVTVEQPGLYTVTVTIPTNGCSTTATYDVLQDITVPDVFFIIPAPLTCSNQAVTLGVRITPNVPVGYTWSVGSSNNLITVSTAGDYTVTITQLSNGCTVVTTRTVTQDIAVPVTIATAGNVLTCGNPSTQLTATGVGADVFVWSGTLGTGQNVFVNAAGIYTVTATNSANGCTTSTPVVVTSDFSPPFPNFITPKGRELKCDTAFLSLPILANGGDSFAWSSGSLNSSITVTAPGTYTVTATNASNGCKATKSIVITQNTLTPMIELEADYTTLNCTHPRAILTAQSSTQSAFTWSPNVVSSNGITAYATAAGTYTVTVLNTANGCTSVASIPIGQDFTPPVATIAPPADLTCAVQSVVLTPSGNGAYAWSVNVASVSGANATVTQPGTYTVTVTAANGCKGSTNVLVALNNTPPIPQVAAPPAITCANPVATLTITSSNSTLNNYAWSTNVNSTAGNTATTLSPGVYSVTITRIDNGCSALAQFAVTQDITAPVAVLNTDLNTLTCTNPTANLIAFGADQYTWSINATTPSNNTAQATASGIYTVTATSAGNGCTASTTILIGQDVQVPQATATVVNVGCNGALTGSVDLSVNVANATYLWNNGSLSEDLSSVGVGGYTCVITGANGCTSSISVIAEQNSPISSTFDVYNVRCNGGNDGRIHPIPTGGTQPYTYSWSNGPLVGDNLNLTSATYTVTITDAAGCIGTASAIVLQPQVLAPLATQTAPTLCNGTGDGQGVVNIVGGVSPYEVLWDSQESSAVAVHLNAGTHTVKVTDANQCTIIATVNITEPDVLVASLINTTIAKCFNTPTGAMKVGVTGGTPQYRFAWSDGTFSTASATSPSAENIALIAGAYYVTVTDYNGCSASTSGVVTQPTIIYTGVTAQTPATCALSTDAKATGVASGGTPAQPGSVYSYRWDSGETSNPAVNLTRGTHTVTATDGNGCTASAQFNVQGPDAITLNLQRIDNVTCNGLSNGAVRIALVGGTPSYLYTWSNGQTTPQATNLPAGLHTVTVTDANGCTVNPLVFNVTQPAPLVISAMTPQNPACNAGNSGKITVTAVGGTLPYSYNWLGGAFGQPLYNLGAGDYTVTVTDANQCTTTRMATITEPTPVAASVTIQDAKCYGARDGRIDVATVPGGGTPPYSYSLDGISFTSNNYFVGVPAGVYTAYVQDAFGCEVEVPATVASQPQIQLTVSDDVAINLGQSTQLQATISSALTYNLVWTPANTLNDPTSAAPIATPRNTTQYKVVVTDALGCTAKEKVKVTVLKDRHVYVPTCFTPNGDGTNDYFSVFGGVDVERIKAFKVFDRWGEQMYEGKDFAPNDARFSWDGRLNGSLLNPGVFVYYIQIEFKDGEVEEFKGDVTLMK
jgi:gliding motility-associated-like protein